MAPGGSAQPSVAGPPETYLYRTGDLARWLPGGTIEFLGRIDNQVKIRGIRIELGEIESRLQAHEAIKEVRVIAKEEQGGDKYLCAYYEAESKQQEQEAPDLREYLNGKLPEYMIPTLYVPIETIPLNANGKVDLKALAQIETTRYKFQARYTPPQNQVEEKLVEIWSGLLAIEKERIGIDENFFQLGGHSLKAAGLVTRIHKAMAVSLPLPEIFKHPTIRGQARQIATREKSSLSAIKRAEKREYYPQSSAQHRFFLIDRFEKTGIGYNMPTLFRVEGQLDKQRLEKAFKNLIKRHEPLRTAFEFINDHPVQLIKPYKEIEFSIEEKEPTNTHAEGTLSSTPTTTSITSTTSTLSTTSTTSIPSIMSTASPISNAQSPIPTPTTFLRPFDLSQAPLLRVQLQKIDEALYLMVDMHHIIMDGTSMGILTDELIRIYEGKDLPPLKIQYKDFAQWQTSQLERGELKKQEAYWLKEPWPTPLEMPTDYPRPAEQTYEGGQCPFTLDSQLTAALRKLTRQTGTTLFMVLLAQFTILLSKYTRSQEMAIGTTTAGRNQPELERVIGLLLETTPLRNRPEPNKTFGQFLEEVKTNTLAAFENSDYPFRELMKKLDVNVEPNRNPLFDVMLILQNQERNRLTFEEMQLHHIPIETAISKLDLTLNAEETGAELQLTLEYRTALFKQETMARFARHLSTLIRQTAEQTGSLETPISQLEIMDEAERQQILEQFNQLSEERSSGFTPVHRLFGEQVERTPDAIAIAGKEKPVGSRQYAVGNEKIKDNKEIKDEEKIKEDKESAIRKKTSSTQLTYKELNEKSNRLAQHLQSKGVTPGTIVAIMVNRSIEMIIGLMGILKSGAAYLPIDPDFPAERINYMLKDSKARILLREFEEIHELNEIRELDALDERLGSYRVLRLEDLNNYESPNNQYPITNTQPSFPNNQSPITNNQSPAYIIYTSGTTGKPKGVMVSHRNIGEYIYTFNREFQFTHRDIVIQQASYTFDTFGEEVYPILSRGGRSVIAQKEQVTDVAGLCGFIARHRATVLDCSPLLLQQLNNHYNEAESQLKTIHTYISGGDVLKREYIDNLIKTATIYNTYGPTESTICATYHKLTTKTEPTHSVPIGKPISNYNVYIIDEAKQLLPVGIPGELIVTGPGVTLGYLNRPELTKERFVKASRQEEKEPEKGTRSQLPRTAPLNKSFWESGIPVAPWGGSKRVLAPGGSAQPSVAG
ncbi:MAG: amino acid adenylation domain-containing protein, partial [bacterium]|nr:amino acid adenylation domain-containing protein [bacterium]